MKWMDLFKMNRAYGTAAFCLLFADLGQAAPYVINSAGDRVSGSAIEAAADGTLLLTTLNGQTLRFRAGTYRQAFADQPPEMARIQTFVQQKNLAAVVPLLLRVKEEYRFLGWDQRAGRMLARVYLSLKQYPDALREYEALFAAQPNLETVPIEHEKYMQALLGAGHHDAVSKMINADIASGSRELAARAQVVRGDLKLAGGLVEEALLDYLRTSILFRAQSAVLPEATYKTAVALKKLNNPRARDFFQRVINDFPESDYAELAREEAK